MKSRVRLERAIIIAEILVVLFLILVISSCHQGILKQVGEGDGEDGSEHRHHYVITMEGSDTPLWKDMYESARETARRYNTLVELMDKSLSSTIEMESLIGMAIVSRMDEIILGYTSGHEIDERINETDKTGIPVVTVLKDASDTSRISFVRVNGYQLGRQYGEQIFKPVPPDKDDMGMMLLLHDRDNNSQKQIVEQIDNLLVTSPNTSGRARLIQETMRSTGKADADETIRNISFRKERVPDVLVYTEVVDTEAAYQAMIDYNRMDGLQLLGYYRSDQILEAVRKGGIPVTLVIDAEQMGRYRVQALGEYLQEGRTNSYYSVDLQFVTKENVNQLAKYGR